MSDGFGADAPNCGEISDRTPDFDRPGHAAGDDGLAPWSKLHRCDAVGIGTLNLGDLT